MTARPLLYAADGQTPIAMEDDSAGATHTRALLLACFGVLARVDRHGRRVEGVDLYEIQQRLVTALVDELGEETIERYYNIQLAPSDDPGPVLPEAGGVQ